MPETQKFTEEELSEIKRLRDENQAIRHEFGQLEVGLLLARQEYEKLVKDKEKFGEQFIALQSEEKELVKKLNNKYGAGTVNLESGEFTPVK